MRGRFAPHSEVGVAVLHDFFKEQVGCRKEDLYDFMGSEKWPSSAVLLESARHFGPPSLGSRLASLYSILRAEHEPQAGAQENLGCE